MLLEQIERKQKKQQEKRMQEAKEPQVKPVKVKGLTQTLGIHNCPVTLSQSLADIAKRESVLAGRRVSVAEVAVNLLTIVVAQAEAEWSRR